MPNHFQSKKRASSVSKPTFEFDTLDEVVDLADEVIYVDLDVAKKNHGNFLQCVADKRHGIKLIGELSITKVSLVNICDLPFYEATLILQGKAVWLTEPTASHIFFHDINAILRIMFNHVNAPLMHIKFK
eukprot:10724504-Ditylum_brightwellii.AAC.1